MLKGVEKIIHMKIRKIRKEDLPIRVLWLNDDRINESLNIQLPVSLNSTIEWYNRNSINPNRVDLVFEEEDQIVAMGGLTNINKEKKEAELYIFVHPELKGKGFGTKSVNILCEYGFNNLDLSKIILYSNADNIAASKLYEKLGFTLEDFIPNQVINNGKIKDRCFYVLNRK